MAYTPINWQTGDTITAEKMNKMDNGWGMQSVQLFSESVTTTDTGEGFSVATLTYSTPIDAESITVSLNGTDYVCPRNEISGDNAYGGVDSSGNFNFTNYPFCIFSMNGQNDFITSTAGTYAVSATTIALEVSSTFSDAVNKCIASIPMRCEDGVTTLTEMNTALLSGQLIYFSDGYGNYFVNTMDDRSHEVYFYPPNEAFTVGFNEDELFTISWY